MGVGRGGMGVGRGGKGCPMPPWILKFDIFLSKFSQKRLFPKFRSRQSDISPLLAPSAKIFLATPGKSTIAHSLEKILPTPMGIGFFLVVICTQKDTQSKLKKLDLQNHNHWLWSFYPIITLLTKLKIPYQFLYSSVLTHSSPSSLEFGNVGDGFGSQAFQVLVARLQDSDHCLQTAQVGDGSANLNVSADFFQDL